MDPLFILLQTSELTKGARRMAETDPHGFILALIAVTTVFTALVILFALFTLVGKFSMRLDARNSGAAKPKAQKARKKAGSADDAEIAAAIAMALEAENGGEVPVAIATALALYLDGAVHDSEPGFITISKTSGAWSDKTLTFRKTPRK